MRKSPVQWIVGDIATGEGLTGRGEHSPSPVSNAQGSMLLVAPPHPRFALLSRTYRCSNSFPYGEVVPPPGGGQCVAILGRKSYPKCVR